VSVAVGGLDVRLGKGNVSILVAGHKCCSVRFALLDFIL